MSSRVTGSEWTVAGRNHPGLQHRGDQCGHIEFRRALDIGLPRDRKAEDEGMQAEDVEQRRQAHLIDHQQAGQHQQTGQHVRDVE
jgi:hypothetical protein